MYQGLLFCQRTTLFGMRDKCIAYTLIPFLLQLQGPYVQCPHTNVAGKKSQRRLSPTATTVDTHHHVFQNGRWHGPPPPHFLVQPPGRTAQKGSVEKETTQPTRWWRRRWWWWWCWCWWCQEEAAEVRGALPGAAAQSEWFTSIF